MEIHHLPSEFLASCNEQERDDVTAWWISLEEPSQTELAVLLDRRRDSRAYVFASNEDGEFQWRILPIEENHLESDDDPRDFERERHNEWLQHVLNHPELTNSLNEAELALRSFHICTSHPLAEAARSSGIIKADFRCPNATSCPIQQFSTTFEYAELLLDRAETDYTLWFCWPRIG